MPGIKKTMEEFSKGKLRSSSGAKVTSKSQAVAIGLSEERKSKKTPKGYHRMPDGKLMKGATHEKREPKAERQKEYGQKKK